MSKNIIVTVTFNENWFKNGSQNEADPPLIRSPDRKSAMIFILWFRPYCNADWCIESKANKENKWGSIEISDTNIDRTSESIAQ